MTKATRFPAVDRKWLEAVVAWAADGNANPLIAAMRIGYPKTEDELLLLIPHLRAAKFPKPRGRQPDVNVVGCAIVYRVLRQEGLRGEQAFKAVMIWAEQNGVAPDPAKFTNYLKRSKQPRRPKNRA